MHQAARLDLVGRVVGELLGYGHVAVEILDEHLEISIQLKEREARLRVWLDEPHDRVQLSTYHGYGPCTCLLGGQLEIQKRRELLGVLKVEFVEAAHAGEQHTVGELLHVAPRLEHHGWIGWAMVVLVRPRRLNVDRTLRQV